MPFDGGDIILAIRGVAGLGGHIEGVVVRGITAVQQQSHGESVQHFRETLQHVGGGERGNRFVPVYAVPTAEMVVVEMGQNGIIEGWIAGPGHTAFDIVRQERTYAPAAFPGGIPAGPDARVGDGCVRPYQTCFFQRAGGIDQHLRPVREDEEGAFAGGRVDEMDVQHPFRPGGEGLSYRSCRYRFRTAAGTAARVDDGRIGFPATGAAAGREKQPGKGKYPEGEVLFHCRCFGKGIV